MRMETNWKPREEVVVVEDLTLNTRDPGWSFRVQKVGVWGAWRQDSSHSVPLIILSLVSAVPSSFLIHLSLPILLSSLFIYLAYPTFSCPVFHL